MKIKHLYIMALKWPIWNRCMAISPQKRKKMSLTNKNKRWLQSKLSASASSWILRSSRWQSAWKPSNDKSRSILVTRCWVYKTILALRRVAMRSGAVSSASWWTMSTWRVRQARSAINFSGVRWLHKGVTRTMQSSWTVKSSKLSRRRKNLFEIW